MNSISKIFVALFSVMTAFSSHTAFASDDTNVIYGDDNRQDVHETDINVRKTLVKSTILMTNLDELTQDYDNGDYQLKTTKLGEAQELCENERFYNQPSGGFCSGFLIANNKIATAGHCAAHISCEEMAFVFDFAYANSTNKSLNQIKASNVYTCKKIIANKLDDGVDFAVIELDRKVENREPLKMNKSTLNIKKKDPLFVIGHPNGIPAKIADGAAVRKNKNTANFFVANLDTLGGNSGSAVFNAKTNEVEGILVRGETDYKFNRQKQCFESYRCSDNGCRGEDVTKIKYVVDEL